MDNFLLEEDVKNDELEEEVNKKLLEKIEYFLPINRRIHKYPKSTKINDKLTNTVITALRTNSNQK